MNRQQARSGDDGETNDNIVAAISRSRLLRYTGWLATCQALLMLLVGSLYLIHLGWPTGWLAQIYTLTAFIMHFFMLAFVGWLLLQVPLIIVLPRLRLIRVVAISLFAVVLAGMLLDGLLYSERQFHISALTIQILGWHTWAFGLFYLAIFAALGSLISRRLWAWTATVPAVNRGKWVAFGFLACYFCSQLIHMWADATYYSPVTRMSYTLPLYHPLTAKGFLKKHGLVDMQQSRERSMLSKVEHASGALTYPLQPLRCDKPSGLNLLVILVDAMRADMLDPQVTPNIYQFSRGAGDFKHHFSGGNSSRMGVFSFFYGLPANYWKVFEAQQKAPVMMDELQRQGYQFGIFGSGPLHRPVSLDRTAFANLSGFQVEIEADPNTGWAKDRLITDNWIEWLSQRGKQQDAKQPFFGFLFYDGPTTKSYPPEYQSRVDGLEEQGISNKFARYQTSVQYDDELIARVLADLEQRQLLESTVVLISSDHGQEFDDSGQGFNGHGSAYNRYQLQVPFILHWPGEAPAKYTHRTSHADWVVTVMQKLLGCSSPSETYVSRGKDLYQAEDWSWLIAGSYHNFAIVSPEQTVVSHLNGSMEVRDAQYQMIEQPQLDTQLITEALNETTRFYRRQD